MKPGCETFVPGIKGNLMPDFTDFDATFEQGLPHILKIGNDEIVIPNYPTGVLLTPRPICFEELEPGGVSCTTRNASFGE
jgi:hypothetical protein